MKKLANHNIQVYISVGSEGKKMEGDAKQLAEILNASGKTNWHADFVQLPDENHLTILHNTVYKALQGLHIKKAEQKI